MTRDKKVICPKCKSNRVEGTCNSFKKDEESEWTGWYCHSCGHWWKDEGGEDG